MAGCGSAGKCGGDDILLRTASRDGWIQNIWFWACQQCPDKFVSGIRQRWRIRVNRIWRWGVTVMPEEGEGQNHISCGVMLANLVHHGCFMEVGALCVVSVHSIARPPVQIGRTWQCRGISKVFSDAPTSRKLHYNYCKGMKYRAQPSNWVRSINCNSWIGEDGRRVRECKRRLGGIRLAMVSKIWSQQKDTIIGS